MVNHSASVSSTEVSNKYLYAKIKMFIVVWCDARVIQQRLVLSFLIQIKLRFFFFSLLSFFCVMSMFGYLSMECYSSVGPLVIR